MTKPSITAVTDPDLIAKLDAFESMPPLEVLALPISFKRGPQWWAYSQDLRRYRESSHRNPLEVVS